MTAVNGLKSLCVTQRSRTVAVADTNIYSVDERLVARVSLYEAVSVSDFSPLRTVMKR
jgi:hypothetical protein